MTEKENNEWFKEDDEIKTETDSKDESVQTQTQQSYEFDTSPAEESAKNVYMIAGEKGEGKTMTGMSFIRDKKRMAVIQFDGKASRIHKYYYKSTPRIVIYDGNKYWDTDPKLVGETSFKSIEYIKFLLKRIGSLPVESRPHFVMFDGLEVMTMIAEFAMRYNNKIGPYAGIKNSNIWKERRGYVKAIHKLATEASLEGVIYTAYMDQIDVSIEEGQVQMRHTEPKWFDVIKLETDIVLHAHKGKKDGMDRYFVDVLSSKIPTIIVSGKRYDVTDRPLLVQDLPDVTTKAPKNEKTSIPQKVADAPPKKEPEPEPPAEVPPPVKIPKPKKQKKPEPEEEEEKSEKLPPNETPEGKQMVAELSESQQKMDMETKAATESVLSANIRSSSRIVMGMINSKFSDVSDIPTQKLVDVCVSAGKISEELVNKGIEALIEKGEIYEPRMGVLKMVAVIDSKPKPPAKKVNDDPFADDDEEEEEEEAEEEEEEEEEEESKPEPPKETKKAVKKDKKVESPKEEKDPFNDW
jgi:hypothetical protein